jgi:transposase
MPSPETSSVNLTKWTREELIQRVRELDAQKLELEAQLRETQEKLVEAQAFLAALQRQLFGPKAEKLSSEQEKQLEQLASDLQEEAQKPSPLIQEVLVEENRRRRPRPRRHPTPPVLETVTVTLEPASKICPHCGVEGQRIGEEVSEEFDLIPAKLIRRRTVRPKYAFSCGEGGVVIAPFPPRLVPQSKLGLGLAAHIVLARYDDHLSFYALERIFQERHAVEIPRQQMVQWVEHIAGWLRPLYDAMWSEMKAGGYLQIDETPVKVLDPEVKGKAAQGYLWFFAVPGGDVILEFSRSRGAAGATPEVGGFSWHDADRCV